MSQLSELVGLFKAEQSSKYQPGKKGKQTPRSPTLPGQERGPLGSYGSRLFQPRDSDAGGRKEMETLQSPIFKAYMESRVIKTPVTDFLRGLA